MYKYQCYIKTVFNELSSKWLRKELENIKDWNQSMSWDGVCLINKKHWKIIATDTGVKVFSNKKFCSPRQGIRFNVEKGVMQVF